MVPVARTIERIIKALVQCVSEMLVATATGSRFRTSILLYATGWTLARNPSFRSAPGRSLLCRGMAHKCRKFSSRGR